MEGHGERRALSSSWSLSFIRPSRFSAANSRRRAASLWSTARSSRWVCVWCLSRCDLFPLPGSFSPSHSLSLFVSLALSFFLPAPLYGGRKRRRRDEENGSAVSRPVERSRVRIGRLARPEGRRSAKTRSPTRAIRPASDNDGHDECAVIQLSVCACVFSPVSTVLCGASITGTVMLLADQRWSDISPRATLTASVRRWEARSWCKLRVSSLPRRCLKQGDRVRRSIEKISSVRLVGDLYGKGGGGGRNLCESEPDAAETLMIARACSTPWTWARTRRSPSQEMCFSAIRREARNRETPSIDLEGFAFEQN